MGSNTYATRANLEYIDQLFQQYKANPNSVNAEWKMFFEGFEFAQDGNLGVSEKELDVYNLIIAYRNYGHLEAQLDPLTNTRASSDQLSLGRFNLSESDLEKKFSIGRIVGKSDSTLKEIIAHLKSVYCSKLTVQCSDLLPQLRDWFIKEFEQENLKFKLSQDEKKNVLASITNAETLEKFIHTRYVGTKRFSVEGGDALLPVLDHLINKGTQLKVEEVLLGMAHRGRVNVLVNFMGKHPSYVFADFNGPVELEEQVPGFDGDVKYHLGYVTEKKTPHGTCKVSLAVNPSHLETVNPVVLGMARAAQRIRKDTQARKKVVPVLIHGDSAFSGQGINQEVFQMSQVKGYRVGGTVHICVDNQIGFTTKPENTRTATYATDIAKMINAPVIHVNGDDVESCVRAMDLAIRYRQEWGQDVVINIICYRRFGHNEGDEPSYTSPLMYDIIKKHPTLREIYSKQLIHENVLDQAAVDSLNQKRMDELQKIYDETKVKPPKLKNFKFEGTWKGLRRATDEDIEKSWSTSISKDVLKNAGKFLYELPTGFNLHPKLNKLVETRKNMVEGREMLDWGTAELLAYGSLVAEGNSVRITGQDAVRGTFTHRHAGFYDVKTGECYIGLKKANPNAEFCVYDSILSEYGVLGYEYGNSVYDPNFLTIWEAQFGDFSNGAQIIIDQYISAAESKWQQMSGLVMLLPHGYEGQGPEHSSARLERYLQLCALHNMQVVNLTTPAQIFHALRRQVRRDYRKPLVVMSPKSLLRHPKAVSSVDELVGGGFQEIISDASVDAKKVEKIIFVSGKLYYELLEKREELKATNTAIVRVEQLYPFAEKQFVKVLKQFSGATKLIWAQEEPQNMGAWQHIYFRITEVLKNEGLKLELQYAGRTQRSSPAVGSVYVHKTEQAELINQAFKL